MGFEYHHKLNNYQEITFNYKYIYCKRGLKWDNYFSICDINIETFKL